MFSPDGGKCDTVAVFGWTFDRSEVSEDALRSAFERLVKVNLSGVVSTKTPAGDLLYILTFWTTRDAQRGLQYLRGAKIMPKTFTGNFD